MPLSARVQSRDGWAIAHAVLTLTDTAGTQVLRAEADGHGDIADAAVLSVGTYVAIVTAVGFAPTAATAIVTGSGLARLGTLTLSRQGGTDLPAPGRWRIDPVHSSVTAIAQHLGISSVRARFGDFDGLIDVSAQGFGASRVEANIHAASIDTGNSQRDEHLKSADFLDVAAFERITYRSTGITPDNEGNWRVHGELSMHGQSNPVELAASYLGSGADPWGGTRVSFRATAELRRGDFALNYNQVVAAGIAAIGTTLRVELEIQAVLDETQGG